MTKRQKFFSAVGRFLINLFTKNIVLKIIAVVFAVMLWGYVLSIENPSYPKTIQDVSITYIGESTLNSRDLMLVKRSAKTTDVQVNCPISKHSDLKAENITCTVDLSSRVFTLDPDEKSKKVNADVVVSVPSEFGTVESQSVKDVELEIARLSSRSNVRVSVETTGSLPEGFTVVLPQDSTISMRGQKEIMDKIASGKAIVDLDSFPTADLQTLAGTYNLVLPVQFYDSSNILVENVTSSNGDQYTVDVDVVIKAYKEIPVEPIIEMLEEGYTFEYKLSRSKVTLFGDRSVLDTIDTIYTTTITATPGMTNHAEEVELELPLFGVETPSNFNPKVIVTLTVTELTAQRSFDVLIDYRNVADDLKVSDNSLTSVTVTIEGPGSAVRAFDEDRITAIVDMTGKIAGTHTMPIRVTVENRVSDNLTITQSTDSATVELIAVE